ncbi:MAG: hypothetical protein AAF446_08615 [Pseudomonadota bacterium]
MSAPQIPLALTPPRRPRFDNFVAGQNQAVVDVLRQGLQPGQWYFLAGSPSSGRSHLAHATLNACLARGESARFVACGDVDVIDLLDATSGDWIVLDDVDQLSGNSETELTLFNALNRWRADQSGIVMTGVQRSDFNLPDLRSRLGHAAKLSLKPLQGQRDELFVALVDQLLRDFQLNAGHGLTDYLLRHAPRSPARMVKLFEQFSERARAERRLVSIPLAREYV